jgi:hypothetical protein
METLSYWLARLEPIIRAETEGEIIVVLANRCGTEGEAVYAGTSAVLGIQSGEVKVYGILGRGEKELLVVDTNLRPQAKLISEPNSTVSHGTKESSESDGKTNSRSSADSTFSGSSAENASTVSTALSVNTKSSVFEPQTPDAMELTMGDIVTPISPVDPKTPNFFFGVGPHGLKTDIEPKKEALQSTAGNPQVADVVEVVTADSPTLSRSDPPPQRSARRAGFQELRKSNAAPIDDMEMEDTPVFVRPPSPKSRNCSRTRHREYKDPALMSHDLAQEPQITSRAIGIKPPPHSASAVPDHYQINVEEYGLGPRKKHSLPRPKSMIW